jgi:hypothetical protein
VPAGAFASPQAPTQSAVSPPHPPRQGHAEELQHIILLRIHDRGIGPPPEIIRIRRIIVIDRAAVRIKTVLSVTVKHAASRGENKCVLDQATR